MARREHDDYFVPMPSGAGEPGPAASAAPETSLPTPRPPGPSLWSLVVVFGGAVAVVAVVVAGLLTPSGDPSSPSPDGLAVTGIAPEAAREAPADTAVDGYRVWARNDDGSPVRWDPCQPIRWVLNPGGAPPGTEVDMVRGVAEVTTATGVRFQYLGTTGERPSRERAPYQPGRYDGDGWAPVLIAWAAPGETDVPLSETDRGVSIPVAVGDRDGDAFVTGQIVFNPDRPLMSGFKDRRTSWGATILHELGHTVGLDHVDDPSQLMYTYPGTGPARFADGDRRGLAELGQGGCLDVPEPVDVDVTYVDDFGRP
jgi:hypothetical protein